MPWRLQGDPSGFPKFVHENIDGIAHVEVKEMEITKSMQSGRLGLSLCLQRVGQNRPLIKHAVWLPDRKLDDKEKYQIISSMVKHQLWDPFGLPWPKKLTPFPNLRTWVGKRVWVRIKDGRVYAFGSTPAELPVGPKAVVSSALKKSPPKPSLRQIYPQGLEPLVIFLRKRIFGV